MAEPLARLAASLGDRYRIERELGAGGMATVYLAEDLKHHRQVAIKVLHAELSAILGPERFLKEIELTANLQHPHILPLFDSGNADGSLYYVTPRVDGESLRGRLTRERQLPIADAVRLATEIAEGIGYAHARGVVHRDIKPENILLQGGHCLVADFGIALAVEEAGGARMTQTGFTLGTPQYMSPEQASGEREVGPASDIYSLGAVTYEMLSGNPPFVGSSARAVVAQVITAEPRSISAQRRRVPAAVEDAVMTALEKVPADRFSSAEEFASALKAPQRMHARRSAARPGSLHDRWLTVAAPVMAAALIAALVWGVIGWRRSVAGPEPQTRWLGLTLPDSAPMAFKGSAAQEARSLDLSPDGRRLVYVAQLAGGTPQLYLRSLEHPTFRALQGTDSAYFPFFSPDGRWIAFFARGELRKVSVDGGAPIALGNVREPAGGAWLSNDEILVSDGSGLVRYSASTGRRTATPAVCTGIELPCWLPDPLPGGEWVLVSGYRDIGVVSLRTGERRTVIDSLFEPQAWLLPDSAIAYFHRPGEIFAVPFDLSRLEAGATPVPLVDGVRQGGLGGQITVSGDGTLVYAPGAHYIRSRLAWVTRGGTETPLPFRAQPYGVFNLSPDGRHLAATVYRTNPQIWIYGFARGTSRPLVNQHSAEDPVWSSDGRSIAYAARRGGGRNPTIMVIPAAGNAPARVLVKNGGYPYSWSANGRLTFVRAGQGRTGDDIWVADVATGTVAPLVASAADDDAPYFSPDGKWVSFMSMMTNQWEVYVEPFPATGQRWTVSVGGGSFPRWSADGRQLYYERNGSFFSVDMSRGPAHAGRPAPLFTGPYVETFGQAFDVARNGRRFLALRAADPRTASAHLTVVLHWLDEVEARLANARGAPPRGR